MCQCLFIFTFMFGSAGSYVPEIGIESLRLGLKCFKSNIYPGAQPSQFVSYSRFIVALFNKSFY